MLNVSCLSESCFVSCDFDLFIDLLFGYSCIELFVKDNADLHVGVSVLLRLKLRTHFGASSYLTKYGSL